MKTFSFQKKLYLGLQLVSRVFEGKEDYPLCSITMDIVKGETSGIAYDKLFSFGKCGPDVEVLFDKRCHRKYLGLTNMFMIDEPVDDFIVAEIPCITLHSEKLAKVKRIIQKKRKFFTKPLYCIEKKRMSSPSGFYKPMFSCSNSPRRCWFAAVRSVGIPSLDASYFRILFCLDCVLASNPDDAWDKLIIRAKNSVKSNCLFFGVLQLWPLYDGFDDYGEFMELSHFFIPEKELLELKNSLIKGKDKSVDECVNMNERKLSFNPIYLQWKNEYGI